MKISKWARVLAISTAVLVLMGLSVSCGGDGDEKEVSGPDEYAKAVCQAVGKHYAEGEALFGGSALENAEDPGEMQDAIAKAQPLIEAMADDLDKIKPPSEVKDWHDDTVAGLEMAAELFGELKDILNKPLEEAMNELTDLQPDLEGMDQPFGSVSDLPSEYQDAFANEPECQGLDFLNE